MKRLISLLVLPVAFAGCGQSAPDAEAVAVETAPVQVAASQPAAPAAPETPRVPYDELLAQAKAALEGKRPDAAIQALTTAIQQEPKRIEAYLNRAALLAENSLLTHAVADMTAAIQIDPESPRYRNTRGYFHLLLKQFDRAEADFNDAIAMDLNYPQPYNNRGLIWLARKQPEDALSEFDSALRIKPDYIDALNNRGFALMQLNRDEEALESLTAALNIDGTYVNALSNRGRAFARLGRDIEAADDFTKAIALDPQNLQYYQHRGQAYERAGKFLEATQDYDHIEWVNVLTAINQLLTKNPKSSDLWTRRANHLLREDQRDEARKSFEEALRLNPQHEDALLGRAELAMKDGEFSRAIELCSSLLSEKTHRVAQSLRGDAYLAAGQFDAAITDYTAVRRFDPQVVSAYQQRAEHHRQQGNDELAQADIATAETMQRQLTEASPQPVSRPARAVVIEPVVHEEVAAETDEKTAR